MTEIQQKFDNFKEFAAREMRGSSWESKIADAKLSTFLEMINYIGAKSPGELTDYILGHAGISRDSFLPSDCERFEKYLEYFQLVAKQVYG